MRAQASAQAMAVGVIPVRLAHPACPKMGIKPLNVFKCKDLVELREPYFARPLAVGRIGINQVQILPAWGRIHRRPRQMIGVPPGPRSAPDIAPQGKPGSGGPPRSSSSLKLLSCASPK